MSRTSQARGCSETFRFLAAFVLLLISCRAEETGEITGRIVDASGRIITGVDVEIRHIDTNVTWDVVTNSDGYYAQVSLPPGGYRVTSRMSGFKQEVRSLTLEVGQVSRLDFILQIGAVSETIEVMGKAPLLESSTASVGQVIESQVVNDMPLNGRNYLDLAKLSIGVVEPAGSDQPGTSGDRAKNGGSFVANGTRSDMNNFILDGIDNNAKIPDLSNNTNVIVQPSVDALREFKVETNVYSAEYGHSAGAVVNATIRSGTNHVHGSLFEFFRNDLMDSRNFYLLPTQATPELRRNQYGATLGGPIRKDQTFFFASWQGTRQNSGASTIVESLEPVAYRSGDFSNLKSAINDPAATISDGNGGYIKSAFPGNIIPVNRISQPSSLLMKDVPLPETSGAANNYVASPINISNRDQWDSRADHNFSNSDRFFVRYSYYTLHAVNPGPLPSPIIGSTNFQQSGNDQSGHQGVVGETHLFGQTVVNEFRAGYNRVSNSLHPFLTDNLFGQYGFGFVPPAPGLTGLPSISINGYSNLGEATFLPDAKGSDTLQVNDGFSWNRGVHFFRAGGEFRWVRSRYHIWGNARPSFTFNGTFTGNSFADFLLGDPNTAVLSSVLVGDIRYRYYGGYANDDWKVTPKLTVNLGLRYEYWTPAYERHDLTANFIVGPNKLIYANNNVAPSTPAAYAMDIPPDVDPRGLQQPQRNNWAPRAGLAYQIAARTVFRTGGGVFYGEQDAAGVSSRPEYNPPFRVGYNYTSDGIHPTLTFATGFPANAVDPTQLNVGTTTFNAWDPAMAQPVIYHWNAGIEQQIGNFLVDGNYVGTKGSHLSVPYNINADYPGGTSTAARRPYQGFSDINYLDSMGNSAYEALQLRVQRRYSNGISLLASYTWSKSIDLGSGSLIGDLTVRNRSEVGWERAASASSVPQRMVASFTYAVPVGRGRRFKTANKLLAGIASDWQVNGILTIRDGHPFTVTQNVSSANTGAARPNWDPFVHTAGFHPTIDDWFDPAQFTSPTQYNFSNEGRDILCGPGAVNLDASIFRRFVISRLGEGKQAQLRFETFNTLNHPQFGQPNTNISTAGAGTITFLTNTMRQVQIGLKFLF
jgi:hypothetical protein